jgi:hypothetical protein
VLARRRGEDEAQHIAPLMYSVRNESRIEEEDEAQHIAPLMYSVRNESRIEEEDEAQHIDESRIEEEKTKHST